MKLPTLSDLLIVAVSLCLLLTACGGTSADIAQSNLQRITSPDASPGQIQALTDGNNAFALDLYQSLRARDANLVYSPYSISLALAMTYAGARGETELQMAQTLHFLPQSQLHSAFNALDLELAKHGKTESKDEVPFQLNIANAVWAEQTFPFQQNYLDLIAQNYGAGVRLADFIRQYKSVHKEINRWVQDETQDKIEELISEGVIDTDTKMVLVNAIYFKADWLDPFDPNDTRDAPFHLLDGTDVQVQMMSNTLFGTPYVRGDDYQAIELPYRGGAAAMDIILPDEGQFREFEGTLDSQRLNEILKNMQPGGSLELGLPKFKFSAEFDLKDRLSAMDMPVAFDPDRADFSGMTGGRDLFIDAVVHEAFVAVDEKGTEAAAATAVIMAPTSIMMPDVTLTIDRPFIFIIRDIPSGQILFVGGVLNPAS